MTRCIHCEETLVATRGPERDCACSRSRKTLAVLQENKYGTSKKVVLGIIFYDLVRVSFRALEHVEIDAKAFESVGWEKYEYYWRDRRGFLWFEEREEGNKIPLKYDGKTRWYRFWPHTEEAEECLKPRPRSYK